MCTEFARGRYVQVQLLSSRKRLSHVAFFTRHGALKLNAPAFGPTALPLWAWVLKLGIPVFERGVLLLALPSPDALEIACSPPCILLRLAPLPCSAAHRKSVHRARALPRVPLEFCDFRLSQFYDWCLSLSCRLLLTCVWVPFLDLSGYLVQLSRWPAPLLWWFEWRWPG